MIISHRHKFIFIKPTKVAGTSMEINLAKHCGPDDIITPISAFDSSSDEDSYDHSVQNADGYFNHITPDEIREKIGEEVFNNYFKFTIVRNPWDLVVSRYWWEKARFKKPLTSFLGWERVTRNVLNPAAYKSFLMKAKKRSRSKASQGSFQKFIERYVPEWMNTQYYLTPDGTPICDEYIMYEDLDGGYKKVCAAIGIPYEPLPRTKTKQRTQKKPYPEYYDESSQRAVGKLFAQEIAYFNHTFSS